MKKIVYLAPLALLGMGVKASANQAPTHISNALKVYEQEFNQAQTASPSIRQAKTEQVGQTGSTFSNGQNQPIGKVEGATHISRLDTGLINEDSSVGSEQTSQVMQIGRAVIPTKQELSESKESVAGQYVQVQQNRVAQFNIGSKIYGLNNSSQLSKNNGDGYVITNAGTYNGRPVDIAVTINNVQNNQGTYTTKWSNGDKADVTGKTDANFKYQDSVLAGTQQDNVTVPDKTRQHTANVTHNYTFKGAFTGHQISSDGRGNWYTILDPRDLARELARQKIPVTDEAAIAKVAGAMLYQASTSTYYATGFWRAVKNYNVNTKQGVWTSDFVENDGATAGTYTLRHVDLSKTGPLIVGSDKPDSWGAKETTATLWLLKNVHPTRYHWLDSDCPNYEGGDKVSLKHIDLYDTAFVSSLTFNDVKKYQNDLTGSIDYSYTTPDQVTDHLQLANKTDANLNYNYTVGLYDAQTGELIKDLTANYKGKTGKIATEQDITMNDAVKAKIQAINANTANSAYTGTAASDDVTFNKNTVHVNYVDTRGESINVPGYNIDVDNLTSGNYQVPQNYVLANTNGFKVTKNTHEVNGITVTDSYNFIDQGNNKVTDNGKTLSVVLAHGTTHVDPNHSGLSNDATNNAFVINNGAKRQINSQSRHFGASGILDLVTSKVSMQGDWQLSGKSNFDRTNINNDLVGYGNAIHSNLTFLAL